MNPANRSAGAPTGKVLVVVGDVHGELPVAAGALDRLEKELGRPIAHVFSVGDFGLFLKESDWKWLSGPKHHRHPEKSAAIARAWKKLALASLDDRGQPRALSTSCASSSEAAFARPARPTPTAGELRHRIPGLRVVGLSGILHL